MPFTTFPITTATITASLVPNIPAGSISSTNVQDAINELASATGNIAGPGSSTDNAIVRWDGTTGGLIKNSIVTITDAGVLGSAKLLTTGSSEARTFETKFQNPISIKDFGAVADGVTDAVPEIQAAIDFAFTDASTHPAVFVDPGTYRCSSRPIFLDPPGNMRGADGTNGGTWNSGTAYVVGNTRNRLSIPYISIQNGTNKPPETEPTFWRPFNWDTAVTYALNDIVRQGGVPWISIQASNTSNDPLSSPLWWKPHYIQPSNFAFSIRLFGLHGSNHEGDACRFNCGNDTLEGYGIIVGPGQGMQVDHLVLYKENTGAKVLKNGRGIAIAGGPGGATRTTIEYCLIEQWEVGIITGFNQDSLSDSLFVVRCAVWGCYIGCQISQTQNFINNFIECSFSNLIQISATNGQSYNVYGGNFSASGDRAVFTLTSVSAFTTAGINPTENTFTAEVTNGDTNLDNGVYERFAVKTERWGVVPLVLVDWNTTTNVITLMIDQNWQTSIYGLNYNATASFSTDIQAVTKLYATEWLRTFVGPVHARGVHIENANSAQTFLLTQTDFSACATSLLEDIYVNNSFHGGDASSSEPTIAWFYTQMVTPHILLATNGGQCKITRLGPPIGAGRVNFNVWEESQKSNNSVTFEQCNNLIPFILVDATTRVSSDVNLYESGQVSSNTYEFQWVRQGDGHSEWQKYWPHPASTPLIEEATLAAWLAGTALTAGSFVPMVGEGLTYRLRNTTTLADVVNIKSNHRYLTLSADITRTWVYKAGSMYIYTTSAANLRPGMAIVLDNGVSGDVIYLIMNVWLAESSANTTLLLVSRVGGGVTAGVAGTEYTAATIKQQLPNVTYQVIGDTNYSAPADAFSMTLGNRDTRVILKPAATLNTGTITMCPNPRDKQVVQIWSSQVINALLFVANAGQSLASPSTTIAAGGDTVATYRAADTTWYF